MNVTEWGKFEKLKEENEKLKAEIRKLKQEINIQKENIFPKTLTLTEYIEINYNYIQNRILNLNFSDKDFDNALFIANKWRSDVIENDYDMLACVGIALAKWNFLSKKEQEILLDKVSFRGGYLKDVLTDYDKEKYSSKQNNENFPEITKEDVFRRWNSLKFYR
ncbi:hypothetical protein [Spiroplasma endosymbiont of Clivina fossor]|uniref:hypothetical protein n=1 Tax=Spiroplasma endosymbiont of Clivina fossor TaxID=3066282 RepID=UPI00313E5EE9